MLPDLRLGIDVGGTNTDAVVITHDGHVLAKAKQPTTPDGIGGISAVVGSVLGQMDVDPTRILHVMLGTTHATNAIVERTRLRRVAVLRIGAPMTTALRPMLGWPKDLREAVSAGEAVVGGGSELTGAPIAPLDTAGIARFLESCKQTAQGVAITSVFAHVSPEQELLAAGIARQTLGDVPISLSHQIGALGLVERENATILNVALADVLSDLAGSLEEVMHQWGLRPTLLFAQNDGTLMTMDRALEFPVLTIGSGPANSIRGAAFLSGMDDALVVDVGGTTTDIGALANGYPRRSSSGVDIGGIRTNFPMPDITVIGIGGGTIVREVEGTVAVGPDSVGYRLTKEALCFGGETPTLADALAAEGRGEAPGNTTISADARPLLTRALERSDAMIVDAVDRMKLTPDPIPVIAIGGGSPLVPDVIPGASIVLRPEHHEVANAIGAAIAHASGQAEAIAPFNEKERKIALEKARSVARERAIAAGANPELVEIVEQEEVPLAYLSDPSVRLRVKAAGPLWGV